MAVRLTDTELLAFIGRYRRASSEPHQDFGDVGFVFEEIDEHLLLEELVAARNVIAAVMHDQARLSAGPAPTDELRANAALGEYGKLFADAEERAQAQMDEAD